MPKKSNYCQINKVTVQLIYQKQQVQD